MSVYSNKKPKCSERRWLEKKVLFEQLEKISVTSGIDKLQPSHRDDSNYSLCRDTQGLIRTNR